MTTIDINGVLYTVNPPFRSELVFDVDGRITTEPPQKVPVNQCKHCLRADWVDRVAYSVAEAVEFDWLIPTTKDAP